MASSWTINVKGITGQTTRVNVTNGPDAIILHLKQQIETQHDNHPPPYRQRLVFTDPSSNNLKLEDPNRKLSSYNGLINGSTVIMVILPSFVLYVTGLDGTMHEIEVPSSDPQKFSVADLIPVIQQKIQQSLSQCQVLYNNEPLEKVRHGKAMTLKDHGIRSSSTLIVTKLGITLNVINPQVDLCFLVDCTGSMGSHIDSVKNCVKKVRDDLVQQFQGCDIRFAFVRYTDYDQPQSSRTTHIDFTKNQSSFYNFVNAISADVGVGGDSAEDVMGGLQAAFSNLSWGDKKVCKVMVHIADAPCHGSQYHNDVNDNYKSGDPAGIGHEQMMAKMISVFNKSLQQLSSHRLLIRQIEAIDPKVMGDAVNRSVMGSIYGAEAARKAKQKSYNLNPNIPEWGPMPELQGKKTSAPPHKSMEDLQKGLTINPPSVNISFKCAPDPFAEGEECLVYHGYDVTGKRKVVLKKYKREGQEFNSLDCYIRELKVRTIVNTYVQSFNDDKLKPSTAIQVSVHPVEIIQCQGSQQVYMLESFLSGNIEKYNNNAGIASCKAEESDMMQAFSHYSWVKSGKSLLICDLQGVKSYSIVILTDPAIHSMTPGCYGFTDHDESGIKRFFKTHKCGQFCIQMSLNHQLP
ncbi:alpha-protein kinase vwkA-like isoform X1 [Dysidea avara]|uniref:alpha-protein kinase vwkA-like isoform X1 n=1 Tax=Dysidea avara TaxID=196820 RepID=UPI0033211104